MKIKKVFSLILMTALIFQLMTSALPIYAVTAQNIPANGYITEPGIYDVAGYKGAQPVTVAANGVALTGKHANLTKLFSHPDAAFTKIFFIFITPFSHRLSDFRISPPPLKMYGRSGTSSSRLPFPEAH